MITSVRGLRALRHVLPFLVIPLLLFPDVVLAQSAWVPAKGEGTVSLIAQRIRLSGHFDTDGSRLLDCAPSTAVVVIPEFEYGITNRIALTARVPYIASRFSGSHDEPCTNELHVLYDELKRQHPELTLTSLDTGSYYATFQDLAFSLRYNLVDRAVVVTPVIAVTIPSHNYRTIGEAAPGQNRLAMHIGANVGALLDPVVPNAYVHVRYAYSFVQGLYGIPLNRSNAEFEGGYAVTPLIVLRGLAAWQRTHGGLTYLGAMARGFGTDGQPEQPELFLDHDRLLATRYWHAGAGATVTLTDTVDVTGAVLTFLAGSESHYGVGFSVGINWRVLSPRLPSR